MEGETGGKNKILEANRKRIKRKDEVEELPKFNFYDQIT